MYTNCAHCTQKLELDEHLRGTVVTCPTCAKSFTVPSAETPLPVIAVARHPSAEHATRDCPHCGKPILPSAQKCKHCRTWLSQPPPLRHPHAPLGGQAQTAQAGPKSARQKKTPNPAKTSFVLGICSVVPILGMGAAVVSVIMGLSYLLKPPPKASTDHSSSKRRPDAKYAVAGVTLSVALSSLWIVIIAIAPPQPAPPPPGPSQNAAAALTPLEDAPHPESGLPIHVSTAKYNIEMILIPAGEFMMGSPPSESGRSADEGPIHKVTITRPFYLSKFEITQQQYEAVVGSNPSKFKGPNNPVEMVRWSDCSKFVKKLNAKIEGGAFRLPTEAEWEYACRAGSTNTYCYGDDPAQLTEYAWHKSNSARPSAVGKKKPNAWGLHDMHGNVWEWCQDRYSDDYYRKSPLADPQGPASGWTRVSRGGSWDFAAQFCRSADRGNPMLGYHWHDLGFRIVMELSDRAQLKQQGTQQ